MEHFNESIIGRKGIRNMSISDLKTGYIVRLRDDNYYVVVINKYFPDHSRLCRANDYNMFVNISLAEYGHNMNSLRDRKYDIVEILKWKGPRQEEEYTEFFGTYDPNNKDDKFGRSILMKIISSGDYETIFER